MKTTAEIVKSRRYRLKLTQAELAKLAGVDQRSVSRIESGGMPTLDTAARLARALRVTLDELAGASAEEPEWTAACLTVGEEGEAHLDLSRVDVVYTTIGLAFSKSDGWVVLSRTRAGAMDLIYHLTGE